MTDKGSFNLDVPKNISIIVPLELTYLGQGTTENSPIKHRTVVQHCLRACSEPSSFGVSFFRNMEARVHFFSFRNEALSVATPNVSDYEAVAQPALYVLLEAEREKVIAIKKGDAIAPPFGVVTWWCNKDDVKLVVLFLGTTSKADKAGEFTDFFLTFVSVLIPPARSIKTFNSSSFALAMINV
ncbi:hypothetical protein IFM89_002516 [Coptis chinensis]|uniref:Uncharacterized protein n=1 Tax=Coptis chinensis TaxID=261450 RepID=A0A835HNC3_9MAGN|nr:hypothetical protein IFM89_002516 [Coptis chinensis]